MAEARVSTCGCAAADKLRAGMDVRPEERLIGVDVADAGEHLLVQERGLDRAIGAGECAGEQVAIDRQCVRAQGAPVLAKGLERAEDGRAPKRPGIAELEIVRARERPSGMNVAGPHAGGLAGELQMAGHAELNDQVRGPGPRRPGQAACRAAPGR